MRLLPPRAGIMQSDFMNTDDCRDCLTDQTLHTYIILNANYESLDRYGTLQTHNQANNPTVRVILKIRVGDGPFYPNSQLSKF